MKIIVSEALAYDDDRLEVRGTLDGAPVVAWGWVSATTNHYAPKDYDEASGQVRDGAEPRAMTPVELRKYCVSLLRATVPTPPAAPRRLPLIG